MGWETLTFDATGEPENISLSPGTYRFECWGAQGGSGMTDGIIKTVGGKGAYASGIIQINERKTFYLYVGTKGENGNKTINTYASGGWNGGGKGGADTRENDGSGGGGGATDIRLVYGSWNSKSSLVSRIIVAAGGSGSAYDTNGAPGGMLTGYAASSTTTYKEVSESSNLGVGDNGENNMIVPSSGAGGGYFGGIKGTLRNNEPYYTCVSSSGTSYVSGFPGCQSVDENGAKTDSSIHYSKLKFLFPLIQDGFSSFLSPKGALEKGHEGNGSIKITRIKGLLCSNKPGEVKRPIILKISLA